MSQLPTVSAITPTKNRRKLLCETMDSVQQQSFENWEHLIVDDGSDDGTAEEVARRAANDPRIRYIQRTGETRGANVCRNLGVRNSRAEFIVFLDSDDLLERDCLARRVSTLQRNADIDFATFQTSVFVNTPGDLGRQLNSELIGDDLLRFLYFEFPWIITGPVWRKESLLRLGLFDETLLSWQDVELHVRALARGFRYLRFPEIDHHVRWQYEATKVSIQQRSSSHHLNGALTIIEKFERLVVEGPGMNWSRQRAICGLYYFIAERWTETGHLGEGLRFWRRVGKRQLGSPLLLASGAFLLILQAWHVPGQARVTHKWKGWMRLRIEPELVRKSGVANTVNLASRPLDARRSGTPARNATAPNNR